jgi:hypothetical protein
VLARWLAARLAWHAERIDTQKAAAVVTGAPVGSPLGGRADPFRTGPPGLKSSAAYVEGAPAVPMSRTSAATDRLVRG